MELQEDKARLIEEIFVDKVYDVYPELTVIDCGANIGLYTEFIHPKAKAVYAIEPSTRNYQLLSERVRNKDLTKVLTLNMGLSDSVGEVPLYKRVSYGGFSIIGGAPENNEVEEMVKVTTLANFMYDTDISHADILKIDIEGAEQRVFSSPDFKDVAGRIELIIGEIHGGCEIEEILKSNGFSYEVKDRIFLAKRI